jgi:hypothetical protein
MILVVTTCFALVLTLQNWAYSIGEDSAYPTPNNSAEQATDLLLLILHFLCEALAFFGVVWIVVSTRRRWLGLWGLSIWLVAQIAQFTLLVLVKFPEQQVLSIASIVPMLIAGCTMGLASTLVTIPMFRLFGYQFRINDQQNLLVISQHSSSSLFVEH